jgi:hypothetical protein
VTSGDILDGRDRGPPVIVVRWAFEQIECEIVETIRRLAALEDPPIVILARRARGTDSSVELELEETDVASTGRLTRAALERARDFASELGHAMNAAAPCGARWTARLFFEREEPRRRTGFLEMKPAKLTVFWSVIPDPNWEGPADGA